MRETFLGRRDPSQKDRTDPTSCQRYSERPVRLGRTDLSLAGMLKSQYRRGVSPQQHLWAT